MSYIVQTNPWGGGDDDSSNGNTTTNFQPMSASELMQKAGKREEMCVAIVQREDLPPAVRMLINDLDKTEGAI